MIALEAYLNGEKICIAGAGDLGVLSGHVCWVRREGEEINLDTELTLALGGLVNNETFSWPHRSLKMNDVVQFKIVETETADTPPIQTPFPTVSEEAEKQYVREMASKFGWTIQENNS